MASNRYPNIAQQHQPVGTNSSEAKDASSTFDAAIELLAKEIARTVSQVSTTHTPEFTAIKEDNFTIEKHRQLVSNQAKWHEKQGNTWLNEQYILFYKRGRLESSKTAIEALKKAVLADTQLQPIEAGLIAKETHNFVKAATSPQTTEEQLSSAVSNFEKVTSPLNKTNAILGALCYAAALALAALALIPIFVTLGFGLTLGIFLGAPLISTVPGTIGDHLLSNLRPRFFNERARVEEEVDNLSHSYLNRPQYD